MMIAVTDQDDIYLWLRKAAADDEIEDELFNQKGRGQSYVLPSRLPKSNDQGPAHEPSEAARRFTSLASGAQPAVVKIVSYAGTQRLSAMVNYISRSGGIKLEDQNGEILETREQLNGLGEAWEGYLDHRGESKDVGVFSMELEAYPFGSEDDAHAAAQEAIRAAVGPDRRFGYHFLAAAPGRLSVQGILVLSDQQGTRLTADAEGARAVEQRYRDSEPGPTYPARFSFHSSGHGVDYATAKMRQMLDEADSLRDDKNRIIDDRKQAAAIVQREWRKPMQSRRGRDIMHLIVSARAGTDEAAFERAARDFLAQTFSRHKYVFSQHDPFSDTKGKAEGGQRDHIHVHALITMKDRDGRRLRTSPALLKAWRTDLAQKAREHGIAMEVTDRRERASAPAYTQKQVRAIEREGRTRHIGTSASADRRYRQKRLEHPAVAKTERSLEVAASALKTWADVIKKSENSTISAYAEKMIYRFEKALFSDESHSDPAEKKVSYIDTVYRSAIEGFNMLDITLDEVKQREAKIQAAMQTLEEKLKQEGKDPETFLQDVKLTIGEYMADLHTVARHNEANKIKDQPTARAENEVAVDPSQPIAKNEAGRDETPFPPDLKRRFYLAESDDVTRVYIDSKGKEELFHANAHVLKAKIFREEAVGLMLDTAAHRGWTSVALKGTKDFRREAWIEANARGINATGYQPSELDWQEVAKREARFLTNEIIATDARQKSTAENQAVGKAQDASTEKQGRRASESEKDVAENRGNGRSDDALNYASGVVGVLVDYGHGNYKDDPKQEKTGYAVLNTGHKEIRIWGIDLPDAIDRSGLQKGQSVELKEVGVHKVEKTVITTLENGEKVRENRMVDRRTWEASLVGEKQQNSEEKQPSNEKALASGQKKNNNRTSDEKQVAKPSKAAAQKSATKGRNDLER